MSNQLSYLPPQFDGKELDLETKEIMREATKANRKLAELKGYSDYFYSVWIIKHDK